MKQLTVRQQQMLWVLSAMELTDFVVECSFDQDKLSARKHMSAHMYKEANRLGIPVDTIDEVSQIRANS